MQRSAKKDMKSTFLKKGGDQFCKKTLSSKYLYEIKY